MYGLKSTARFSRLVIRNIFKVLLKLGAQRIDLISQTSSNDNLKFVFCCCLPSGFTRRDDVIRVRPFQKKWKFFEYLLKSIWRLMCARASVCTIAFRCFQLKIQTAFDGDKMAQFVDLALFHEWMRSFVDTSKNTSSSFISIQRKKINEIRNSLCIYLGLFAEKSQKEKNNLSIEISIEFAFWLAAAVTICTHTDCSFINMHLTK